MTIPAQGSLAGVDAATGQRWYEIRALAGARVEIYLYDVIGGWGITAQQFINDCKEAGVFEASAIDLHIHSPGGDVMQGFAIYNTLARLKAKLDIWVDGVAASMASMIVCLPGATVHMPENAWIMVHKPWGGIAGDSDDMREYADWLDRNEALMLNAYINKTGLPKDEVEAMLKAETWLNGAEAVARGFADTLEPELQAAACINQNQLKDYHNMPQQMNSLFAPRAQTNPAPQAPAPQEPQAPQTPHPASQAPTQPVDIAALASQLQQRMQTANAERVTAVNAVFENFPAFAELRASCVSDFSVNAEQAREKLLAALAAGTTPTAAAGTGAHIYAGNGNLVGDSIRASVMHRAGHAQAEKDNRYTGYTLRELARASLVDRGIGISGASAPMQMVALAFTHSSSDFGAILMDVAHKSALQGWDDAVETFDRWTLKGTLTDFKTSHRVGLESFPNLRQVRPGAEYKYVTLKDRGEPIALATYGELFSIDRQTIINDDMSMLTRIPMAMGSAARSTIGDLVYAVLTGKASAEHSANSAVTQAKKNGRQMSLSGPVRPEIVRMTAECRITTQGFGEREDFAWQTESVQFSLEQGGFTFDISLKTDITAKGKNVKGKGEDYGIGK